MQIRAVGLPAPVKEYRFCDRKWRFDYAWPAKKLALEVHGATWTGGRHVRGGGFERDREKMNVAQLLGWTVLEVTMKQIDSGQAIEWLLVGYGEIAF